MDRLVEIPEIFCETCCNYDRENMDMGGNTSCKAIGVHTYSENYAGDCRAYNVPKEQIVVLPCNVGDKVFRIFMDCPKDYKLEYCTDHEGSCENCHHREPVVISNTFSLMNIPSIQKFGKTAFTTREEAEAALKEMEK